MPSLFPPNWQSAHSGGQARGMARILVARAHGADKAESCGTAPRESVPWRGSGQLMTGPMVASSMELQRSLSAGALMAPVCFVQERIVRCSEARRYPSSKGNIRRFCVAPLHRFLLLFLRCMVKGTLLTTMSLMHFLLTVRTRGDASSAIRQRSKAVWNGARSLSRVMRHWWHGSSCGALRGHCNRLSRAERP